MGRHGEGFWTVEEWFLARIRDARLRWPAGFTRLFGPKPIRFLRRNPIGRVILFGIRWAGHISGWDIIVQRREFVNACWR